MQMMGHAPACASISADVVKLSSGLLLGQDLRAPKAGMPSSTLIPFLKGLGSLINPFKQKRAPFLSLGVTGQPRKKVSRLGDIGLCVSRLACPSCGGCNC